MARVTTLIYKATGRKNSTSGTVTPTPTTQTIRLPLVTNTQTIYPPELVADNLIQLPLVVNEQVFYPPTLSAAPVFIALPLVENSQTFFPLTVKLSVSLPLVENTQEFYPPQIVNGQVVVLPLVTNSQTFYGPQLNQRVELPLVTNEQTFFGMDIRQDKFVVLPLVTNEQVFYPPQLNQKVALPLVTNSQTFYPPTLANGQVVRLPFWANGQTFFPPKINQKIILGFVNNTQTFYPPILSTSQVLALPLVTNTQTFYPPELQQKITLPLVTNTSTVFPPAVVMDTTQVINLPLVTNTQTFFGPKLNQQIRLPKVTNTSGFFTLTVSNGPKPGFALSTPSVTVISAAGEPPEVTLGINSDHYAGYYLDIERSTVSTKNASDGSYASPTLKISHQITATELAELEITNTDLAPDGYVDPTGVYFQQYRIRREDGALSARVEISGTVTASVGTWNTTTGVNKSQYLTITNNDLTGTMNNSPNGGAFVRCKASAANTKFHMELTIAGLSTVTGNGSILFGMTDGTTSFVSFPQPGQTSPGLVLMVKKGSLATSVRRNGTSAAGATLDAIPAVGDVLVLEYDQTGNAYTFKYKSATGTKTIATGTLTTQIPPTIYACAGGYNINDSFTANFGGSAFAVAPTSGYGFYA